MVEKRNNVKRKSSLSISSFVQTAFMNTVSLMNDSCCCRALTYYNRLSLTLQLLSFPSIPPSYIGSYIDVTKWNLYSTIIFKSYFNVTSWTFLFLLVTLHCYYQYKYAFWLIIQSVLKQKHRVQSCFIPGRDKTHN